MLWHKKKKKEKKKNPSFFVSLIPLLKLWMSHLRSRAKSDLTDGGSTEKARDSAVEEASGPRKDPKLAHFSRHSDTEKAQWHRHKSEK